MRGEKIFNHHKKHYANWVQYTIDLSSTFILTVFLKVQLNSVIKIIIIIIIIIIN